MEKADTSWLCRTVPFAWLEGGMAGKGDPRVKEWKGN